MNLFDKAQFAALIDNGTDGAMRQSLLGLLDGELAKDFIFRLTPERDPPEVCAEAPHPLAGPFR